MTEKNFQYKIRFCWKCKRKLTFQEFYNRNRILGKIKAINFWQNQNLEFYCCLCYKKEIQRIQRVNLRKSLEVKRTEYITILQLPKTKLRTILTPIKCKIEFIAQNSACVSLKNHSIMQDAVYNIFAQIDPLFSYAHYNLNSVKPWSFSLLKFNTLPVRSIQRERTLIKPGVRGYFFLKTIDPKVYKILMQFMRKNKLFQVGKLKIIIERIETFEGDLYDIPESIDSITVRLEAPTFFYNNRLRLLEEFSAETLLNYQCEKFKQLDIMDIKSKQLYPYLRIFGNNTRESVGYITNSNNNDQALPFRGIVGNITFKIYGNSFERILIWKILYLSEFTGIGTRTSMGFGHSSLISVK